MNDDDLKSLIETSAAETRRLFDETRLHLETKIDQNGADMRRQLGAAVENFDKKIQDVAELVALVDERLDRETKDIRKEMRQGFADTQAMIKFSHSELDRRVRTLEAGHQTLEETVFGLVARIERLEGSTH